MSLRHHVWWVCNSKLPSEQGETHVYKQTGDEAGLTALGRAFSGVDVRVVDEAMRTVERGAIGEIAVRGPVVMSGYWRSAKASAETLVDGWLRTGDLGAMDSSGQVTLKGRSKDVVISGGLSTFIRTRWRRFCCYTKRLPKSL